MDPSTNETPGLGLPRTSDIQAAPVIAGHVGGSYAQDVALPSMPTNASIPADDSTDDLDQVWVSKAKAIVDKTKNDPFVESEELSKMKADYLKTRYNKHIKVSEDRST